jgi:secondary thiamine-phosphate synthase enzyme
MTELVVETTRRIEALDITDRIPNVDHGSFVWLATPHTTAALVLCEADEEMLADLERSARELPAPLEPFRHARSGNPTGAAHLVSALAGTQLVLPITDGRLELGQWQRVVLLDLDGPKQRRVLVRSFV